MNTQLDDERFLRLNQIVPAIIPISRASWWAGIKKGRFPRGVKLSPRVTVWRASDVRALLERGTRDE